MDAAVKLGYATSYFKSEIQSLDEIRWAIGLYRGCLLGLNIHEGWNNVGADGVIPEGGKVLGGHGVWAVSFFDEGQKDMLGNPITPGVVIANSWGRAYGKKGFVLLPWEQLEEELIYGVAVKWVF